MFIEDVPSIIFTINIQRDIYFESYLITPTKYLDFHDN